MRQSESKRKRGHIALRMTAFCPDAVNDDILVINFVINSGSHLQYLSFVATFQTKLAQSIYFQVSPVLVKIFNVEFSILGPPICQRSTFGAT